MSKHDKSQKGKLLLNQNQQKLNEKMIFFFVNSFYMI